jgi:hypothetical protein
MKTIGLLTAVIVAVLSQRAESWNIPGYLAARGKKQTALKAKSDGDPPHRLR